MKDTFVEQFFVLINPVWDSSSAHTMTDSDLADFGQLIYLNISLNNNMYTHASLTVSSITMPSWVGASKNNLALVYSNQQKKLNKFYFLECLENLFTLLIKTTMLQGS